MLETGQDWKIAALTTTVCVCFFCEMMFMKEKYINKIIELALIAEKKDCVPVGAIVVKNNKIIGKGYNKKEKTNNPMDHAEIIAIKKACRRITSWRLEDCELYVTMKPCDMCKNIILETRMTKIYYLVNNEKEEYKNKKLINNINFINVNEQMYEEKYIKILRSFFLKKRKKNIQ